MTDTGGFVGVALLVATIIIQTVRVVLLQETVQRLRREIDYGGLR